MTSRRPDPTRMSVRFVDLPGMPETFSDSIQGFAYDGDTLRIVFSVTRLDDPKPGAATSARQYPSCRLVLTRAGALELLNSLHELRQQLLHTGDAEHANPAPSSIPRGGNN